MKFWKCLVLHLGCGCMTFSFTTQITLRHVTSYPCPSIKNLNAKTTKSIPECLGRSLKRKSNMSFIRVIKNSSVDQHFLFSMVHTFLKILWWRFFVPCLERLLVSSATLSCKTLNISTLLMLVNYNKNSFFLRSSSFMHCLVSSVH